MLGGKSVKRVIKGIILIILQGIFLCSNVTVKAEELYDGHTFRMISILNDEVVAPYIEIEDKHGYCYDFTKDVPNYDQFVRVQNHEDDIVLAMLYHGHKENSERLREEYGITEDEAIALTQAAIWHYREGWGEDKIVHPYMRELIKRGLNKELPPKQLTLQEDKLKYLRKDGYFETELIDTDGFEGNFTIRAKDNVVALDSNGRERYRYRIGESFKLRNYGEDNTDTINITGDMNVLELDLYDSLDDTVQDVIATQYVPVSFDVDYAVESVASREMRESKSRERSINSNQDNLVKTSDLQSLVIITMMIIFIGIAIYIGTKEISRNKR